MNQTNEHPAPTDPTRVTPQVVHVVAKPGGLSTALWFIVGLFVFAAVFVVGLHDLVENFTAADQPQVGARALFSGFKSLLEIDDLGIEYGIALLQARVQATLLHYGSAQMGGLAVTIIGYPQLGLQRHGNQTKYHEHPAHLTPF